MAYLIKRHEAIIPQVGQIWEANKDMWEITNILKVGGAPYQVVVTDRGRSKARTKTVTMKYFQRKFQYANVWIPPRLQGPWLAA